MWRAIIVLHFQPNPSNVKVMRTIKDHRDFETSAIGIQFIITQQHFIRGKLKVRIFQFCIPVVCGCGCAVGVCVCVS